MLWTKSIHRFLVFVYLSNDKESQGLNIYWRTWSLVCKNQFFYLEVVGGTEFWCCAIHETGECWLLIVLYSPVQMYFYFKGCCSGWFFSLYDGLVLQKSQIPSCHLMLIQEVNGQNQFDSKKTFSKNYCQAVINKTTKKQFYGKNFGQNRKCRPYLK